MQIQFRHMTLYNCGATYSPKHPENDPACTLVTDVTNTLRLQVYISADCPATMLEAAATAARVSRYAVTPAALAQQCLWATLHVCCLAGKVVSC